MSERVAMIGLVDAGGLGGSNAPGEPWYAVMHLAAWRRDGGAMMSRRLRVENPIDYAQLDRARESNTKYAIVRLEVDALSDDATIVKIDWSTVRFGVSHAQLEAERERLKRPVVCIIDGLGAVTLDRTINTFDGMFEWCGKQATIMLAAENDAPHPSAVRAAMRLVDESLEWNVQMRAWCCGDDVHVQRVLARRGSSRTRRGNHGASDDVVHRLSGRVLRNL